MCKITNTYIDKCMYMADTFAKKLSPDSETKVGAILLNPIGDIVASGYNCFVQGADEHILPKTASKGKHEYIQHAERNVLYNCLNEGINTKNCIMICTLSPCLDCFRACWQSGITSIFYKDLYHRFSNNNFYEDLKDINVKIRTMDSGITELKMSPILQCGEK